MLQNHNITSRKFCSLFLNIVKRGKGIETRNCPNSSFSHNFSIKRCFLKTIPFSEAELAGNFDINPTSIHVQRFTGHVCDWSVLNDWPTQKIDLLTPTWSLCIIAK